MAQYVSSYSGADIDDGILKGKSAVQTILINGNEQTKSSNGVVNLPAYPPDLTQSLNNKVDKVTGKGLSSNDYTNEEKTQVEKISGIEGKIPSEASSTNKLADKEYVDNKVATNSGTFRGTYDSVEELPATGNNNNDYANVTLYDTEHQNIGFARYTYVLPAGSTTGTWTWQYDNKTNNFTPAQNNAINSGITETKVSNYDSHLSNQNDPHNVANTTMTMKNKTIDCNDNTLSNIPLSSIANQNASNFGKPIIVGNNGLLAIGDNTPTYVDISEQLTGNAYNQANLTFSCGKMVQQNGLLFYRINCDLNTEVVDKQSSLRKVMELPTLSGSYSYPSRMRITLTQPTSGTPTCQENVAEYYNPSGAHYVNPADFTAKDFLYTKYTAKADYGSAESTTIVRYLVEQKVVDGAVIWDGQTPRCEQTTEHATGSAVVNAFILRRSQETASQNYGYFKYTSYYDEQHTLHTGIFWELTAVTVTLDPTYMYYSYLAEIGVPTDSTGNWGKYSITENSVSKELKFTDTAITGSRRVNHGVAGTYSFIQASFTGGDIETKAQIVNNAVYVPGNHGIASIDMEGIL